MNALVFIALFGWIPLTILLFFRFKPHHAAMISVIGGTLFLPMTGYNLPGLPPFTKNSVIAIGLILGGRLSGARRAATFRWTRYDLPMLVWCACPLATSISNGLGWYDGMSGVWASISVWGIPYLAGRIYIDDKDKLRDLCFALVIGGLLYLPLCLFEIRMSPKLSKIVYGFFPHSFAQHMRYGGYRPIVFMQHGLMVSLWMALTTTAAFWLWRSGQIKHIKGFPFSLFVLTMVITTILCKSANGWIALFLGMGSFLIYRLIKAISLFRLLFLLNFGYILLRISGLLQGADILAVSGRIFDPERISSLAVRLLQEDLFVEKTMQRFFLGWGGYKRGWPVDEETGRALIGMIDSQWLIAFNIFGFVGLFFMMTMLWMGPAIALKEVALDRNDASSLKTEPVLLSVMILLFMMDNLVNGMINPAYILVSGALLGWALARRRCVDG